MRENLDALCALGGEAGPGDLTRRQNEVVTMVALGLTNEQIARRLGLSSRTVRKHIEGLFARTGARSRTELAVHFKESAGSGLSLFSGR